MNIQMVDLLGQYNKIKGEINARIDEVIRSSVFVKGGKVIEFVDQYAVQHVFLILLLIPHFFCNSSLELQKHKLLVPLFHAEMEPMHFKLRLWLWILKKVTK